jgi:hypothetical protein
MWEGARGGGIGFGFGEVDEFDVGAVGEDEKFVAGVAALKMLGLNQRGGYGRS